MDYGPSIKSQLAQTQFTSGPNLVTSLLNFEGGDLARDSDESLARPPLGSRRLDVGHEVQDLGREIPISEICERGERLVYQFANTTTSRQRGISDDT